MMNERAWIQWLQDRWPHVDFRHDTYLDPNTRQILTTDMLVEDVHFSWDYFSPQDLGWKSLAASLSDIAATGGKPQWVLVSLGIQSEEHSERLLEIAEGIDACCRAYQCQVVGGDTVQSEKTVVSITATGLLPVGSVPGRRHLAKPGDLIAMSGPHGLSQAGLVVFQNHFEGYPKAKAAHLRPQPKVKLGQRLAQVLPRFAMMDSSDGLANAVIQLSQASHVNIILDKSRLAIPQEVQAIADQVGEDPMDWVLYGGEDFQLVMSMPPETIHLFPELIPIGYVTASPKGETSQAYLKSDQALASLEDSRSFQHFLAASGFNN